MSEPLRRLQADAAWFARAQELRLHSVRLAPGLRGAALKLLPMLEFHADNFSPWVVLEDASEAAEDGWRSRANRLLLEWERRREAFRKDPEAKVELPQAAVPDALAGRPAFAAALRSVLAALRPPLRGLVIALAPPVVEDAAAFAREVGELVAAPALADIRWVLVLDEAAPPPRALLEALGAKALATDCVVDPDQQDQDLQALASAEPGGAPMGMAGPRGVKPPPRVDDPPPLPKEKRDAALREAGVDPALLDAAPQLRQLVLGAAMAMKEGRGNDAVRMQREARDLSARAGQPAITAITQIALASYLSGLERRDLAAAELREAVQLAQQHRLGQYESQARLALALLMALDKKLPEAAREYAAAGRAAEEAKVELLAIEAWRLAGQFGLQAGVDVQTAMNCFREALRIAAAGPEAVAQVSSAPEAARRLASLLRDRGMAAQAASLEEQALAFERGGRAEA